MYSHVHFTWTGGPICKKGSYYSYTCIIGVYGWFAFDAQVNLGLHALVSIMILSARICATSNPLDAHNSSSKNVGPTTRPDTILGSYVHERLASPQPAHLETFSGQASTDRAKRNANVSLDETTSTDPHTPLQHVSPTMVDSVLRWSNGSNSSAQNTPSQSRVKRGAKRRRALVTFDKTDPSLLDSSYSLCNPDNKPDRTVEDHLNRSTSPCPFHFVCKRSVSVIPSLWWEAELSRPTNRCPGTCQRITLSLLRLRKKALEPRKSDVFRYKAIHEDVTVGFVCLELWLWQHCSKCIRYNFGALLVGCDSFFASY